MTDDCNKRSRIRRPEKIGRIVALAREEMKRKAEPGMSTKDLDLIGKAVLDEHGAVSAPEKEYDFPVR